MSPCCLGHKFLRDDAIVKGCSIFSFKTFENKQIKKKRNTCN